MNKVVHAICLALMLVCTATYAATPADERDKPASADKPRASQPPPGDSRQRRQKPAGTFTPSEKVGADSAVAFPVDI